MIEGCIERLRLGACGGCERRDICVSHAAKTWTCGDRASRPHPFFAFLAELAMALGAAAQRSEGAAPTRPEPGAFRREVEGRLESMLTSGAVRIDRLARELGLSRQTLYRRLKAEGATFAGLLDGVRRRLALRFIREEGLSVKEAAYRLGFSDPAAFSRAFKRWTGASPRAMRG